jgi:hypothetical protein
VSGIDGGSEADPERSLIRLKREKEDEKGTDIGTKRNE